MSHDENTYEVELVHAVNGEPAGKVRVKDVADREIARRAVYRQLGASADEFNVKSVRMVK